jgi:hypothetical protein
VTTKADEQKERRALAGSTNTTTHQRGTSTLLDHVTNESGGRFAELARRDGGKPTVIGTAEARYPAGPAWAADPCGVEPALGFSVEDLQPTGEPFEVERAAEIVASREELAASPEALTSASQFPGVIETGDAAIQLAEVLPRLAKRRRAR